MDIKAVFVFFGPNIVSFKRAARVVLRGTPHPLATFTAEQLHQITSAFNALISENISYFDCSFMSSSVTWAGLFSDVVLELQKICRHPEQQVLASRDMGESTVEVAFTIAKENGTRELAYCALAFINYVLFWDDEQKTLFINLLQKLHLKAGFSLSNLFLYDRLHMANLLAVPIQHETGSRYFLGQGKYREILGVGRTTKTTAIGKELSGDKARTTQIIIDCGLPAPRQLHANTESEAIQAARAMGFPLVLKPRWGSRGRAVSVNLNSEQEISNAFQLSAEQVGAEVVIETFLRGEDHRLLVVGEKMIAAVKRIPARVLGDGKHTLSELLHSDNLQQRRDGLYLFPLKVDAEVNRLLAEQTLGLDDKPAAGQVVWLRKAANQSLGGTTLDVTDQVHPDIKAMAVAAAKALFLDIAGIDFVTEDISKSWREGGGIVEVNAYPGVDLHMCPSQGKSRAVSQAMIREQFPVAGGAGRIPVVMILGQHPGAAIAYSVERLLAMSGYQVGLWSCAGKFIRGAKAVTNTPDADIKQLFTNPVIDAAVFDISMDTLALQGAPVDNTAITILTEDSFSEAVLQAICDEQANGRIRKLAVELATHKVITSVQLYVAHTLADYIPAPNLILIIEKPVADKPLLRRHLQDGGWIVRAQLQGDTTQVVFETANDRQCVEIAATLLADTNNLQALLVGFATLMGLGYDFKHCACAIQQLSKAETIIPSALQTLVTKTNGILYWANHYDLKLIDELQRLLSITKHARVLIFLDTCFQEGEILGSLVTKLYSENVWFYCNEDAAENLKKCAIPAYKIMAFAQAPAALEALSQQYSAFDRMVLFAADELQNNRLIKGFITKPVEQHGNHSGRYWDRSELEGIFEGKWISGINAPEFEQIYADVTKDVSGGLVIISEQYCQESAPRILHKMQSARSQGAAGIIASVTDVELPKYFPVLLCDAPFLGLQKLAHRIRHKLTGKVIAFIGTDQQDIYSRISNNKKNAYSAGYVHEAFLNNQSDTQTLLMQALINLSPVCKWVFFYLDFSSSALSLLQPDVVVLYFDSLALAEWPILAQLLPKAKVRVLCEPEQQLQAATCFIDLHLANFNTLLMDDYLLEKIAL